MTFNLMTTENIKKVDRLYVSHAPIIKTTGMCGIAGFRHDPSTGATLLLSEDRSFLDEWHEGAHSFITQRTPLGFLIVLLSNALHFLTRDLFFNEFDNTTRKKKNAVLKRLHEIRKIFISNYRILHEMFALFTERRGIIEKFYEKGRFAKIITEMDREIFGLKEGWQEHKKALILIHKLLNEYKDVFLVGNFVELLLNYSPVLITNVNPETLLYDEWNKIKNALPYPITLLEELINDPPNWASSQNKDRWIDAFRFLINRINSISKYQHIMEIPYASEWIPRFLELLPLSEKFRDGFNELYAETWKYFWIIGGERQKELKQYVEFIEVPLAEYKKRYGEIQQANTLWKEIFGVEREDKKEVIAQDPITISPPTALLGNQNELMLLVRSDIYNTANAFSHMAYRHFEIGLSDKIFEGPRKGIETEEPIICFYSYTNLKNIVNCDKGPGKCGPSDMLYFFMKVVNQKKPLAFNPILVCCREEKAIISRTSEFLKESKNLAQFPFRIVEHKPMMFGFKMPD